MPFHDHIDHHGRRQTHHSHVRHQIDWPGQIVEIGHHLFVTRSHHCLVRTMSCAGAILDINRGADLGQSFFLVLHGSHEEIGATEFRREGDTLWIRFNMLLDPDFVKTVIGRKNQTPETVI